VSEKTTLNRKKSKSSLPAINPLFAIIIVAYGFVTVLTPNLNAFDSNGPKFLSLSLLNIVVFLILLSRKEFKRDQAWPALFFRNPTGFIYTLFLLVTLASFVKAINHIEALVTFAKVFTVFTAAFLIAVIMRRDKRYLLFLAVAMSVLLVVDSLTVFYHIASNILDGKGPSIYEIKSVYSNKNILSASIFVKIPFALWLLTFEQGWKRNLGHVSFFVAFLAALFMSTRAFYLGLIVLFLSYITVFAIRLLRNNEQKRLIRIAIISTTTLIIGFLIFTGTQKFIYPASYQDLYTVDFFSRLKTIQGGEPGRTNAWERSFKLISENPLLGVGIGNWKIAALKYENLTSPDYIYMYKNHNDFIENAAETGIPGGLLFLGIFILILYQFSKATLKQDRKDDTFKYMFIPAFGLLCYSFDAFFNFPADRPEMLSLFALYVGTGIGLSPAGSSTMNSYFRSGPGSTKNKQLTMTIITLFLCGMLISAFVFYRNFVSLKLQRMLAEDMSKGTLSLPSDIFLNGFPTIPDLNVQGEPIAVHKARYLISEKRYPEAISLLKADRSSPYDTRPEFFISTCYIQLGNLDSALYYYEKVFRQKPHFYTNTRSICSALQAKGRYADAARLLGNYTQVVHLNQEAWVFRVDMLHNAGDDMLALSIADSALTFLPGDVKLLEQKRFLEESIRIKPYAKRYQLALAAYNEKRFAESCIYFTDFISLEKGVASAFEYRAYCHYYLKDYTKSIDDINSAMDLGVNKAGLHNLRGVNLHMMGNDTAACVDFQSAISLGDKDAEVNYNQFCIKRMK